MSPKIKQRFSSVITFLDRSGKWIVLLAIGWMLNEQALPMLYKTFKEVNAVHDRMDEIEKRIDDKVYIQAKRIDKLEDGDKLIKEQIEFYSSQTQLNTEAISYNIRTISSIQNRINKLTP